MLLLQFEQGQLTTSSQCVLQWAHQCLPAQSTLALWCCSDHPWQSGYVDLLPRDSVIKGVSIDVSKHLLSTAQAFSSNLSDDVQVVFAAESNLQAWLHCVSGLRAAQGLSEGQHMVYDASFLGLSCYHLVFLSLGFKVLSKYVSDVVVNHLHAWSRHRWVIGVGDVVLSQTQWQQIRQLAAYLNAPLVGTQPVITRGDLQPSQLIGISGRALDCDYYLALGISGSMQHLSALSRVKHIIAINSDRSAAIFWHAKVKWVVDIADAIEHLMGRIIEVGIS